MNRFGSLVLIMLVLVAGCAGNTSSAGEEACMDCITAEGTVRYSNVEGGFWYLEADDGSKYDPYGVPEEFAIDGLRVRFTVNPQPERMGFHMVGTIVELVSIEALEGSGKPTH